VVSPLLSNVYLTEVDRMLERAIATTRNGKYTYVQYARFADDLVILVDSHPRHDWLVKAVNRRLREEVAKLRVEINEEKSRLANLAKGDSFGSWALNSVAFGVVRERGGPAISRS
jgi:RNA-directed DNA polymerase